MQHKPEETAAFWAAGILAAPGTFGGGIPRSVEVLESIDYAKP